MATELVHKLYIKQWHVKPQAVLDERSLTL